MTITGEQLRAARHLLGWSRIKLAVASLVGRYRIEIFERRTAKLNASEYSRLKIILEGAGIEFTEGEMGAKLTADEIPADTPGAANDR